MNLSQFATAMHEQIEAAVLDMARSTIPGPDKAALVNEFVMQAFDQLWPTIVFPVWLRPIAPFLAPLARKIVAAVVDAVRERLYQLLVKKPLLNS
jgi:hypothetical protein